MNVNTEYYIVVHNKIVVGYIKQCDKHTRIYLHINIAAYKHVYTSYGCVSDRKNGREKKGTIGRHQLKLIVAYLFYIH